MYIGKKRKKYTKSGIKFYFTKWEKLPNCKYFRDGK